MLKNKIKRKFLFIKKCYCDKQIFWKKCKMCVLKFQEKSFRLNNYMKDVNNPKAIQSAFILKYMAITSWNM